MVQLVSFQEQHRENQDRLALTTKMVSDLTAQLEQTESTLKETKASLKTSVKSAVVRTSLT